MTAISEPLQPLTLGEVLDRTALLFRRNFFLFVGVPAVPTVVIVAAFAITGAAIALFGTAAKGSVSAEALAIWLEVTIVLVALPAVAALGHGSRDAAVTMFVAEILNLLVNFAFQTLISPVYIAALVLFYYDQRIRTKGYDIEWMMAQAGLTGPEICAATTHTIPDQTGAPFVTTEIPDTVRES